MVGQKTLPQSASDHWHCHITENEDIDLGTQQQSVRPVRQAGHRDQRASLLLRLQRDVWA